MKRATLALAAVLASTSASAQSLDEVARRYAPTILQETQAGRGRRDFISTFDYDCDWNGDNNRQNLDRFRLPARVYFAAYETPTHWFVHYLPYHATDDKLTNGHEHDTESLLLVVRRTGAPFGALEAMEVRFHTVWYQYAVSGAGVGDAGDNVDGPVHLDGATGRPMVYQQAAGHGLCGGFAPPCITGDYCDLAILCLHDADPHFNRRGVRYRYDPEGSRAAEPAAPGDREVVDAGYDLVPIESTLWARRMEIGRGRIYGSAINYDGSRCRADAGIACPRGFGGAFEGDEGDSPGAMWAQEGGNPSLPTGEVFFDPAYAMSRRLRFPAPFSLTYTVDPYAGVGSLAAMTPGTICEADAGTDAGADASDAREMADAEDALDVTEAAVEASVDAGAEVVDVGVVDAREEAAINPVRTGSDDGGCGCRATGAASPWSARTGALVALVMGGLGRSRRRSQPRGARRKIGPPGDWM
jgi:MYXO-CTERM domain-containing protein